MRVHVVTGWSSAALAGVILAGVLAGCSRDQTGKDARTDSTPARTPIVTVSADQAVSPVPPWQAPVVVVTDDNAAKLRKQAASALEADRLFGDAEAAIPLYLALRAHAPEDAAIQRGLQRAVAALVKQGEAELAGIDEDPLSLRRAHEVAAVARVAAPGDETVAAFLERLDRADEAQEANRLGENELNADRLGENGNGGAMAHFREALRLRPGDVRAMQGLAAAESTLIRRAELSATADDYVTAEHWLDLAGKVRPGFAAVDDARARIAMQRIVRVGRLRDMGLAALSREDGINEARSHLATLLRIAPSADPAAAELRQRIDLATHYGLFRPGQVFTDAIRNGGRGPQMTVIPHGAFRMGADEGEPGEDSERPARNIRFERGLAVSRFEITVGEFRRFVLASGHRPRATRRGYSTAYDERSGNFVRRGNVDWQADYVGNRAADSLPVVHVSAKDAMAYAQWLSEQTGQRYRLLSEAEFEYALRAGGQGLYPWGRDTPPDRSGNFTGALDESPSGRHWRNTFARYGDGSWGPAPVGHYAANAFGLHDMEGNVSEWVADCWHDTYRRAPRGGEAWVNPGCRERVVRGGSWASSPEQTRSSWRMSGEANSTTARTGFRVAREI